MLQRLLISQTRVLFSAGPDGSIPRRIICRQRAAAPFRAGLPGEPSSVCCVKACCWPIPTQTALSCAVHCDLAGADQDGRLAPAADGSSCAGRTVKDAASIASALQQRRHQWLHCKWCSMGHSRVRWLSKLAAVALIRAAGPSCTMLHAMLRDS